MLRSKAKSARELFSTIQDELDHRKEDVKDGLSFLDMKNDTLLSYMIDVCNIVLHKVREEPIGGHRSVERCVEYRVILEKVRAIDSKLAYQLNKLISLPDVEEEQGVDIRNLDVDIESDHDDDGDDTVDDEDDDSHSEETEKTALYKPPKLRSVAPRDTGRKMKHDEFYQDEDREEPQTRRVDEERVRYEEENYTRLPDKSSKKSKKKLKKRRK